MAMDSPLKAVLFTIRNKFFVFCLVVLLSGFLLVHYVVPENHTAVFSQIPSNDTWNVHDEPWLLEDKKHDRTRFIKYNRGTTSTVQRTQNMESKQCKKKFDVSFLKVHKAGSTTLMNIFLRFAISHELNVVLPQRSSGFGFNYLGYGQTVSNKSIVPLPANESYNILCNHVVYNKQAFRSIMPSDTTYVGILREPKSHFTSAAVYYGFYNHLRQLAESRNISLDTNIVNSFLKNPNNFSVNTYFVYNRMSFDFGIPKAKFHDDSFVETYIEELGRDYELVMLMEQFHESLVLMKRMLCWTTKDILYVPLNAMHNKPNFDMSMDDIERLKTWNSADFKLYDFFRKVFDTKLKAEGPDFNNEVKSFKTIQGKVKNFCLDSLSRRKVKSSILTIPSTQWDSSFLVTPNDCQLMTQNELSMMKSLIEDGWKRYNESTNKQT